MYYYIYIYYSVKIGRFLKIFDLTNISAPTKAVVASNPITSRPEATAARCRCLYASCCFWVWWSFVLSWMQQPAAVADWFKTKICLAYLSEPGWNCGATVWCEISGQLDKALRVSIIPVSISLWLMLSVNYFYIGWIRQREPEAFWAQDTGTPRWQ